ncbi:hypothetical protein cand_022070 [Cryptosporidium andersoni]|uniref:Uncharacterized protein n=1 Tax=Cryptosporidium andersoni TaxID=117008 RepID=A0A1J4MSB6_9CRYT|nr:hypothetical protein cand_022070 [Cryptosporidium andersoni]
MWQNFSLDKSFGPSPYGLQDNILSSDSVRNSSSYKSALEFFQLPENYKRQQNYRRFLSLDNVLPWSCNPEEISTINVNTPENFKMTSVIGNVSGISKTSTADSSFLNIFSTSPTKSDVSTAAPSAGRSPTCGASINRDNLSSRTSLLSSSRASYYDSYSREVPPLPYKCFDNNQINECNLVQINNLIKALSPAWVLCIDVASILLTNTDNKMALSNIGPKLSWFARDALRQIKQKKLSRFIRDYNTLFDIRRPSPSHSALYVTLKFPLPGIVEQFLPIVIQLRKAENEKEQTINNNLNYWSNGEDIREKSDSNFSDIKMENKSSIPKRKNAETDDSIRIYEEIPNTVKSQQAYECWLCVREFATVLLHQPTQTMELREIGVLMSQKAKIQAKRNSAKKNYKSFLLSYPNLFRIFGKDDNHSIQWIGTYQDFIKLNSIKYVPPQTDEELFNIPTLNQSHTQFLFGLNNDSSLIVEPSEIDYSNPGEFRNCSNVDNQCFLFK